jgi:hypothetical protein
MSDNNKIFRFNLSDELMVLITHFAKMHQYDDRHTYKDAWQIWLKDSQELVDREISRLQQSGYKGDVLDKMFKAGRYYFREKKTKTVQKDTQVVVAATESNRKKRDYIVMQPEIIQAMDTHLTRIMKQTDFKPAKGYVEFCEQQIDLLRGEIKRLIDEKISPEKISEKIKKTYKNRYFMLNQ